MPGIIEIGPSLMVHLIKIEKDEEKVFKNSEALFTEVPGNKNKSLTPKGARQIKVVTSSKQDSIYLKIKEYYKDSETLEYVIIYWPKIGKAYFYNIEFSGRSAIDVYKYYTEALKKCKTFEGNIEGKKVSKEEYLKYIDKVIKK
ncbi:MAG: hypothetical protein NT030_05490 [Candidatus Saganbacteria bacterium]|nr:hypothetical protein [Candidatus Saganbacteria bacterium]